MRPSLSPHGLERYNVSRSSTASHSRLVFQPDARERLLYGIRQMVDPIRMTLGPLPRTVAYRDAFNTIELLDRGSVVARRIEQLADRDADMGAMLVRHLVARVGQTSGDATATAAVLFEAVFQNGLRLLGAGGNAMQLREQLLLALDVVMDELAKQVVPLSPNTPIAPIALALSGDAMLSTAIGGIFEVLDENGQIDIRTGHGREDRWDYVDGAYWPSGVLAPELLLGQTRLELDNPAIIISDLALREPSEVAPAIEAAVRAGKRSLVIFAAHIEPQVTAFLVANGRAGRFPVIAAKAPDQYKDRAGTLNDIAALVGGRPFLTATNDTFSSLRPADLGSARRVWADRDYVGLAHGQGDSLARQAQVQMLHTALSRADAPDVRERLRARLGKLLGGSAILWVGGVTERDMKQRKALAESTIEAVRGVLQEGVLPGGGSALLCCRQRLLTSFTDADMEKRTIVRGLANALEAPARAILNNAGYEANTVIAHYADVEDGVGFDVLNEKWVKLFNSGIVESAGAYQTAVRAAISAAATALTIEVLVHTRHPETVLNPA